MTSPLRAAMPPIDARRLWARVETLSGFTLAHTPWTRRAFSDEFLEARRWLRDEMHAAGLKVTLDAAGNLVGRRAGRRTDLPSLVTGSHCDTVVGGGRFDGIIGVLAGIEIAQTMLEHDVLLEHPLQVIDFLSEEPSDYGISCVGSRGMTGVLDAAMLAARNAEGESLADGLRRVGGNPAMLTAPLARAGDIAAFVELHIEQGPVLESERLPIGIVTDIVGIRRVRIQVHGRPDHAGTTPMDIRRDALVGAAAIIEAVHAKAGTLSGNPHYVVATIGHIAVTPNVANAVPGVVDMVLEIRSNDAGILDCYAEEVLAAVQPRMSKLRLTVDMTPLSRSQPTACAPLVMGAAQRAAADLGYGCRRLSSGAGHDAAYMAACGPTGMIFIPCLDGRSHCPEEWIEPHQLLDGTRVLYRTLTHLDEHLVAVCDS